MITACGRGRFRRRRVCAAPWGLVGAIAPRLACYRLVFTDHVRARGVRMATPLP